MRRDRFTGSRGTCIGCGLRFPTTGPKARMFVFETLVKNPRGICLTCWPIWLFAMQYARKGLFIQSTGQYFAEWKALYEMHEAKEHAA